MGRHGGKKRRFNPLIIGLGVLALVLVIGLGWWWWSLRSATDPVSADPVQAYATVTASGPCTVAGSTTTVNMNTQDGQVSATLKVCGYRVEQSILVEYLKSDPQQARVFGTTTAPTSSAIQKLLPIAILLLGVVAAGAALAMLKERRKPRSTDAPVSVAELRAARLQESAQASAPTETAVSDQVDPGEPDVSPSAEPSVDQQAETGSVEYDALPTEAPTKATTVSSQPITLSKPDPTPEPVAESYDHDLFGADGTDQHPNR